MSERGKLCKALYKKQSIYRKQGPPQVTPPTSCLTCCPVVGASGRSGPKPPDSLTASSSGAVQATSTLTRINLKMAFSSNALRPHCRFQSFLNSCSSTLKRYVPVLRMREV